MGKPYAVIANRVSRLFARSIIWQLETMRIQPEDAFRLLNVKNDKAMRQLANEVGVFCWKNGFWTRTYSSMPRINAMAWISARASGNGYCKIQTASVP